MQDTKKITTNRSHEIISEMNLSEDIAAKAMQNVHEIYSEMSRSNSEYMNKLVEADKAEYDVLVINMQKAESEEERANIRDRMKEMKKERYDMDTENKNFLKNLGILIICGGISAMIIISRKSIIIN